MVSNPMIFKKPLIGNWQISLASYDGVILAVFLIAIYFSTSLAIILSAVIGVVWLISGRFRTLLTTLKQHPVACWSVLLYVALIVGLSYGHAELKDGISMIMKYRELVFIPILISLLSKESYRHWLWLVFILSSLLTLLASYVLYIKPFGLVAHGDPCLKSRITHGIFIAFFAFYCLHKIYRNGQFSKLYSVFFIVCVHNLFFVVNGRTGQLILVALIVLFVVQQCSIKNGFLILLAFSILLGGFLGFSDKAARIKRGFVNTYHYLVYAPEDRKFLKASLWEHRYTYWKYSVQLMAEKPLLGQGTGGFFDAYKKRIHHKRFLTKNPHNEFLMIGTQLGVCGLVIYLAFLYSQYRDAKILPQNEKQCAQGLLLSLLITSIFNTPFFDHTEGHWFASMIALCFAAREGSSEARNHA